MANDSLRSDTLRIEFTDAQFVHIGDTVEWRFILEDDLAFADPGYDDSEWMTASLQQLGNQWQGVGWLRIHIHPELPTEKLTRYLYVSTNYPFEVYINGFIAQSNGKVGIDESTEILEYESASTNRPSVYLENGKVISIAIRISNYSHTKLQRVTPSFEVPKFDLYVSFSNDEYNAYTYHLQTAMNLFHFSGAVVFLMIFVLHLFLYLADRTDQVNFWLVYISGILFVVFAFLSLPDLKILSYLQLHLVMLYYDKLIELSIASIPIVIAHLLNHKKMKVIYAIYVIYILQIVAGIFFFHFIYSIKYLTYLGLVAVSAYVIAKNRSNASRDKIAVSLALTIFPFMLGIIFILIELQLIGSFKVYLIIYTMTYFAPAIGLSIFQIVQFVKSTKRLEEVVQSRTQELQQANIDIKQAFEKLQAAQQQLVQQEKLASLGQLTAGIAHEIKNPLNFVNNFSSVSIELVDEALEEVAKIDDVSLREEVSDILTDIRQNLTKIHEHGTRADNTVKSMLMHSRSTGSGKKEPTQLASFLKEYVNLSYHGMRAGPNPIDVDVQLDLDTDLPEVSIIQEDFSRAIINICMNAFDAMREKIVELQSSELYDKEGYKPKLMVRTSNDAGKILIEIEDNGPGIPDDIRDKILHPFFTTKKGTQGTGLGLSITHDIIKAHNAELVIESVKGHGSIFRIVLSD